MKILAFLQNQWFRNPERIREQYQRRPHETHASWMDWCSRLNKRYLFYNCLTGRRLCDAFGEDLIDRIVWENVSPHIAGKASECFGVDQAHVDEVVAHFKPDVVLLFGKVAQSAVICDAKVIFKGPHPAARHAGVAEALRAIAGELRQHETARAAVAKMKVST